MRKTLEYRGYIGSADIDLDGGCLFGKALFLSDSVIYQGATPAELEQCFHDAIDEYLETCEEIGKAPDKPFSGLFNVRMDPDLHKGLAYQAASEGIALNAVVIKACQEFLRQSSQPAVVHNHTHKYVTYQYVLGAEDQGMQASELYSADAIRFIDFSSPAGTGVSV